MRSLYFATHFPAFPHFARCAATGFIPPMHSLSFRMTRILQDPRDTGDIPDGISANGRRWMELQLGQSYERVRAFSKRIRLGRRSFIADSRESARRGADYENLPRKITWRESCKVPASLETQYQQWRPSRNRRGAQPSKLVRK